MRAFQHLCLSLCCLCLLTEANAQYVMEDFSFHRYSCTVSTNASDTLAMPWAGGMNAVHFSEIDLDLDGVNDLFAFEKHGSRILTFLRRGDRYIYAPQYAKHFPELHDWVILKDYNGDGKPDIFTYGLAGVRVFRNVSDNQLAFQLVTEQLQAYYYNGYVNIFASPDDYLIVEDIDHDGHLDLLNFWVLGKYVHHLRNYSDDPNVFDFRLETECWGHFEEAGDNNTITLFSDCDSKEGDDGRHTRHTGSSMLLHDFDHNGLPDILLGDIDYPNLMLLYNHGTLQDARMTAMDTAFPAGNPVHLYSMPAPALINLPGQAAPSMLVSPSDPALSKSQDLNSVWRYDYDTLLQQYTLTSTAFLQEEMIDVGSGCHPVLFDWNGDGLQDLFLANYGSFDSAEYVNGFLTSHFSSYIRYYQNTGTASHPIFQLTDEDFGQLKALNLHALHPAFGEFTCDGYTDMLCGLEDGTLLLVPHQRLIGNGGETYPDYLNIDVGKFSTPTFFDLDGDGRKDLIIGNQRGLLSYYHNIGICGLTDFEFITDTLGGVDVRNPELSYFGYSVPCLFRDSVHGTVLFCGSEQGHIFHYHGIDENPLGTYTFGGVVYECADSECQQCATPLREGRRTAAALAYIDDDPYPDLIVGNYAGGAAYLKGRTPASHESGTPSLSRTILRAYPNPTSGPLTIDTDSPVELVVVYDLFGKVLLRSSGPNIHLGDLPDGMYILEINRQQQIKIVKVSGF